MKFEAESDALVLKILKGSGVAERVLDIFNIKPVILSELSSAHELHMNALPEFVDT
jgi:hypothetical protein